MTEKTEVPQKIGKDLVANNKKIKKGVIQEKEVNLEKEITQEKEVIQIKEAYQKITNLDQKVEKDLSPLKKV